MRFVWITAIAGLALAGAANAQVRVKGYTRSDGTYVAPHVRSRPDNNVYNNYSTRPNVNPYTGRQGTVDPYSTPSQSFGTSSSPYGSVFDPD